MRTDRDFITALASGTVGALALASSMYNVYLQREQTRAQVLPSVHWNVGWVGDDWLMVVGNDGVGPAEVRRIRVSVDGAPVQSWVAVQEALVPGVPPAAGAGTTAVTSLRGGQTDVVIFGVNDPILARGLFLQRKRLGVELCYCSVLADCWVVGGRGLDSDPPQPVRRCDPDPTPFQPVDDRGIEKVLSDLAASDAGATKDAE